MVNKTKNTCLEQDLSCLEVFLTFEYLGVKGITPRSLMVTDT